MTPLASIPYSLPKAVRSVESSAEFWGRLFIALILGCWGVSFVIGFETALAMLAIGGFAAVIVGLFRPVIGLLGIGVLCTIEPLIRTLLFTGGLWRWHTLEYWLSLVAIIYAPLLLGLKGAQTRLVQLFAALVCLEVLVSPNWYGGLSDVAGVVALFGLVVYFARAAGDAAAWRWLGLVCGTAGAVGGMAFLAKQVSLPYINPNTWAYLPLTALVAICLAFPLARPWVRGQVLLVMLAAANYTLVFLSGSRGSLLTATGCGIFLLIQALRMRGRWLVAVTAPLVALAVTTQFSDLPKKTVSRINVLLDARHSLVERTSGRSQLVVDGWNMFLEHPLGVGTGGYALTRTGVAGGAGSSWRPDWALQSHTAWIKVLAENGLPGIALMGAYVISFAVAGWRSRNRELFALGLLVTVCLGLGFVSTEFQSKGLWFLAAGGMVSLRPGSVWARKATLST